MLFSFFFFNDTATTEIYTLSLHDALPIYAADQVCRGEGVSPGAEADRAGQQDRPPGRGAPAGARRGAGAVSGAGRDARAVQLPLPLYIEPGGHGDLRSQGAGD